MYMEVPHWSHLQMNPVLLAALMSSESGSGGGGWTLPGEVSAQWWWGEGRSGDRRISAVLVIHLINRFPTDKWEGKHLPLLSHHGPSIAQRDFFLWSIKLALCRDTTAERMPEPQCGLVMPPSTVHVQGSQWTSKARALNENPLAKKLA